MITPEIYYVITGSNIEAVNGIYAYDTSFLLSPRYFNTKNNNKWFRIMRPGLGGRYGIQDNPSGDGALNNAYYITSSPIYPFFSLQTPDSRKIIFTLGSLGSTPIPEGLGSWKNKNLIKGDGGTGKLTTKKRN